MQNHIAITASVDARLVEAKQLADKLHLPYLDDPQSAAAGNYDYLLIFTPDTLGLIKSGEKITTAFNIDFLSGKLFYRCQQASLRKELLARAIGKHPREPITLVDATAGLGRDSFILASLGFHVTLLERSPIIHALLKDAHQRAKLDPRTAPAIERMQILQVEAKDWLINNPSDVIYLDPMFPERQKSAAVKKEMVILQQLLGKEDDANDLFNIALHQATQRIIVKRPRLAENIANQAPNFSLMGKSSRFDIYLTQKVN